jgi:ABC-type nitrate/sulfonate/bicarbonate transport system ATPase subunit/ABC-type transporter Mla maintaining outer membrane lipid asymmetry permease subunit MlaE
VPSEPPPSSIGPRSEPLAPLAGSEPASSSGPDTHPDDRPAVLSVRRLDVALPGGAALVERADFALAAGQIVSLVGPSGAGKSTLVRALVAPEELRRAGFSVAFADRAIEAPVAFIPQRGALFDHLDVAGNVALASSASRGERQEPASWLRAVDLDAALAEPGTSVATLSGGQAQRVAVARTLAAGRSILVLDEPSVGLDPLGVRKLAKLLVDQARERGVAIVLITHDLALAAGASDQILFLDPSRRALVDVMPAWAGPAELASEEERRAEVAELDAAVARLLDVPPPRGQKRGSRKSARSDAPSSLHVAGAAVLHALDPRLFGPSTRVMLRAVRQSLLRPMLFYAIVGALLGFTVLYIIAKMSADLRALSVLRLVGGTYILSLAPPLSAILFAATSGNAINAWLGGMALGKQILALDGIGVPERRYLWSPAWLALAISYVGTVLVFVASMIAGGYALFQLYGGEDALAILTSDFLDPAPGRGPYLVRGIWLVAAYAIAIATIVVQRGVAPKDEAAHVTQAMTSAVVRVTLFVVAMELASVVVLFAMVGR